MSSFKKLYQYLFRIVLPILYPVKALNTGFLPKESVIERVLIKNKKTLTLPDDGNGSKRVNVDKKEMRILSDVVFWPSLSIVQVNQKTLDIESELNSDRLHAVLSRKYPRIYPTIKIEGYVTSIDCAPRWRNYYHWCCESLPRIWALYKIDLNKYKKITLLSSRNFKREEQSILEALLPPNVSLKLVPNHLRVRSNYIDLPILTETGLAYLPKDYLKFFRTKIFSHFDLTFPKKGSRKIYISRGNASRRRFLNEREVSSLLTNRGYEKHNMDGLTIREQAVLFSSASHIISPHGAALTNLLYANKNAKVLEIHHSKNDPRVDAYYRGLANSLGLCYKSIWLNASNKNENTVLPLNVLEEAMVDWEG